MFKTTQCVCIVSVYEIIKKSCVDTIFVSNGLHVQLWPDAAEVRSRWPIRTKHALHQRHSSHSSKIVGIDPAHKDYEHASPDKSSIELACSRDFELTILLVRNAIIAITGLSLSWQLLSAYTHIIAYRAKLKPANRREYFHQQLSLLISMHIYIKPPQEG